MYLAIKRVSNTVIWSIVTLDVVRIKYYKSGLEHDFSGERSFG